MLCLPLCLFWPDMVGVDVSGGTGTLKLLRGWPWPRFGASTERPGA
jgi:hypothetical protein